MTSSGKNANRKLVRASTRYGKGPTGCPPKITHCFEYPCQYGTLSFSVKDQDTLDTSDRQLGSNASKACSMFIDI